VQSLFAGECSVARLAVVRNGMSGRVTLVLVQSLFANKSSVARLAVVCDSMSR
jgi:hypothetical protein